MTDSPAKIVPADAHQVAEYKHASPLVSCRIDPLGRYLFAGGQIPAVQRWSLDSDATVTFTGHDSWVWSMDFDPTAATLVTAGYDGRLIWWETSAETPQPQRMVDAHDGWTRAVAYSPDGLLVASCGNDNLVKLWNAADGTLVRPLEGHACHVYNLAFTPDGKFLVSGDLKGRILQWDVTDGNMVRELDATAIYKYDGGFKADIGGVRGMAFSPDGKQLACCGITNVSNAFAGVGNPAVVMFDFDSGESRVHKIKEDLRAVCWAVAFHPDGFLVGAASGGSGGYLAFWQGEAEHEVFKHKLPNRIRAMSLHAPTNHVALAGDNSIVRLYDLGPKPPEEKDAAAK